MSALRRRRHLFFLLAAAVILALVAACFSIFVQSPETEAPTAPEGSSRRGSEASTAAMASEPTAARTEPSVLPEPTVIATVSLPSPTPTTPPPSPTPTTEPKGSQATTSLPAGVCSAGNFAGLTEQELQRQGARAMEAFAGSPAGPPAIYQLGDDAGVPRLFVRNAGDCYIAASGPAMTVCNDGFVSFLEIEDCSGHGGVASRIGS